MKNRLYTLWVFFMLVFLFIACERDGVDEGGFYPTTTFTPITDLKGEGGYGKAVFTWTRPDSTSSLFYVEIVWLDNEKQMVSKVIPKYQDSVAILDLVPFQYNFKVISHSTDGAILEDSLQLEVKDWKLEPPAQIQNLVTMVAENTLQLFWQQPEHPTYNEVVFEVFKDESLVSTGTVKKEQKGEYVIQDLAYKTGYVLKYFSKSISDVNSEIQSYEFVTGDVAPEVPVITLDDSRINAAYCAEIVWNITEDMDSLRVVYTDLQGKEREYRFGSSGKGYLSLLPGGTVNLKVQARGTNGIWSLINQQKLRTKFPEETYLPRMPNGADTVKSKLSEVMYQALGRGTYEQFKQGNNYLTEYSFKEMGELTEFTVRYGVRYIDEIELFVRLKRLAFEAPEAPSADITVESMLLLAEHLPLLTEILMVSSYPNYALFETAFAGHPKVKFVKK